MASQRRQMTADVISYPNSAMKAAQRGGGGFHFSNCTHEGRKDERQCVFLCVRYCISSASTLTLSIKITHSLHLFVVDGLYPSRVYSRQRRQRDAVGRVSPFRLARPLLIGLEGVHVWLRRAGGRKGGRDWSRVARNLPRHGNC